ncbi:MAG: sigma-70 family RNA polymerase sigma factor, partial [Planctomycetes bacterium]|nr:sigma-70 family RNA polymerase sigma factor [Planctomycetota bacterium]
DKTVPSEGRAEPLYNLIAAEQTNPAEEAAARDLVRALHRMIDRLPPRLRRITEMSLEGLSTKEICKRLGFTRQAINRSKNRAQVLLRRHLEGKMKPVSKKRKSVRKSTAA